MAMSINDGVVIGDTSVSLNNVASKITTENPVILYDDFFQLPTGGGMYGSKKIHLNDDPSKYDYLLVIFYDNGYTTACILPGGSWGKTTIKRARVMTRYINEYFQMSSADSNNDVTVWFEGDTPMPNNIDIVLHIYGMKTYGGHLY